MGKPGKGQWGRWHRYREDGSKEMRCFPIEATPTNIDSGCTPWVRGTGTPRPEVLVNMRENIRRTHLGVPKSPQQREKMRLAKLGKPKTPEHRRNMSIGQLRRIARLRGETYADTESNT